MVSSTDYSNVRSLYSLGKPFANGYYLLSFMLLLNRPTVQL